MASASRANWTGGLQRGQTTCRVVMVCAHANLGPPYGWPSSSPSPWSLAGTGHPAREFNFRTSPDLSAVVQCHCSDDTPLTISSVDIVRTRKKKYFGIKFVEVQKEVLWLPNIRGGIRTPSADAVTCSLFLLSLRARPGGVCLSSQPLGCRSRRIVSLRPAWTK